MLIRVHTAMSLDGFSAGPDGWPVLLQMTDFTPNDSYGHGELAAECPAVIMGRTTYEPALGAPSWPWAGRRAYVVTSRPCPAPDGVDVVPCGSVREAVKLALESGLPGDAQVLGGPSTIRECHRLGVVDRLEIEILPLLMGSGLPLFPIGPGLDRLRLIDRFEYADGTIKLCYTLT